MERKIDELKIYDYALAPNQTSGIAELSGNNYSNIIHISQENILSIKRKGQFEISDSQGRIVKALRVENENQEFNISELALGLYWIKESNANTGAMKFLKR